MDYMMLASSIVANALIPSFKTIGNNILSEVGKKVGAGAFDQREMIVERVKSLFAREELTTLNLLAEHPDDLKAQGRIEGQLHEKLKANPDLAKELEKLLKNIPIVQSNTATQTGNENVLMQDSNNSTVTFNK